MKFWGGPEKGLLRRMLALDSVKVAVGVLWGGFKKVPPVGGQSHGQDVVCGPDRLPAHDVFGVDVGRQRVVDYGVAAKDEGQLLRHAPRGDV